MDFKSLFDGYLTFVNRFVPQPRRPPVLGIDIGTSAVKAVEITLAAGDHEIRAWAVEPIQDGDVKSALSQLLKKIRYAGQTIVTSVSGKGTLMRYIDLPRMPLADLRKSFTYDLDKYFPFDPQSIYTDCVILDPASKDKHMFVLVAAVKKEIVDEKLKLFKGLGLEVEHITTNSIAVVNAFAQLGPPAAASAQAPYTASDAPSTGQAKAILDIGGSMSNLLIVKDRSPRFTRDIFVGSEEMTRQIAHALGVDASRAEAIKRAPGERLEAVMAACESPITNLIEEVRLSLDYFITEKNIQVDEFFLLGGGSLLKGIAGAFEKSLGIPVKTWDPLAGLAAGGAGMRLGSSVVSSEVRLSSSQLGVAIGLGLSDV